MLELLLSVLTIWPCSIALFQIKVLLLTSPDLYTRDISIGYCFVRKFLFVCVYTSDDSIEMFGEKVTPSL